MSQEAERTERRERRRAAVRRAAGVGAVLAVALALRLIGITWGLPDATHLFSYHPDEFHSLRGALSMALGDPNPHFFNYGSLYLHLVGIAAAIADPSIFLSIPNASPGGALLPMAIREWTLDARIVTVILGVATVAVVYALARTLWDHRAGLLAGLLLAVMPLHVLHSHYATVDVPGALFTTLALLFAVWMVRDPNPRYALWAGAAAGLAASTKYSGAIVLVAPLTGWMVAWALAWRGGGNRPPLASLLVPPAAALAAFALTSPFTFLDWPSAWRDISFEMHHMRVGDDPSMMALYPSGWLFHLHGLVRACGLPVLLAVLVGLIMAWGGRWWELLPLLAFGVVAFAVSARAQVRYARYEVPLLPVIAIIVAPLASRSAWAAARAWLEPAVARLAVGLLLVAAVAAPLLLSADALYDLVARHPRAEALAVLEEMVPRGGSIGLLTEPWFYHPPVDYCNGGAALRDTPLWRPYRRPVRELAVVGVDGARVREELPHVVVITDFELGGRLRLGDPAARELMGALVDEYERAYTNARRPTARAPFSPGRMAPQDWRYPTPRIEVWGRR
ncbi:MAG: glycosyltransferase family 39 protein [Armatimonadota bacterium]|nr:glycosyltransferase family 39 protein [Armatimonadota bacterium]